MDDIMSVMTTALEQIFRTVEQLGSEELELLRERIERSSRKKPSYTPRGHPEEAAELFAIPFDTYLAMSEDERAEVAFRAYIILDRWIERELKARQAQWMLVCGGEILESSAKLIEYPSREKLMTIGKDRGVIPFVFIRAPLIEESNWSVLSDSDYYPTLPITGGRFRVTKEKLVADGIVIEADFDTGSPHLLLDYNQMLSNDVVDPMPSYQEHFHPHLGEYLRCYLLPIQIGVTDASGQMVTKEFGAFLVRNWRQTSLCWVNPDREALAGRNLLLEFPLKVELDGEKKTTRVIGKKTAAKKSKKK
jgi:hypothetical protein